MPEQPPLKSGQSLVCASFLNTIGVNRHPFRFKGRNFKRYGTIQPLFEISRFITGQQCNIWTGLYNLTTVIYEVNQLHHVYFNRDRIIQSQNAFHLFLFYVFGFIVTVTSKCICGQPRSPVNQKITMATFFLRK